MKLTKLESIIYLTHPYIPIIGIFLIWYYHTNSKLDSYILNRDWPFTLLFFTSAIFQAVCMLLIVLYLRGPL
jgi:hypothetical protein